MRLLLVSCLGLIGHALAEEVDFVPSGGADPRRARAPQHAAKDISSFTSGVKFQNLVAPEDYFGQHPVQWNEEELKRLHEEADRITKPSADPNPDTVEHAEEPGIVRRYKKVKDDTQKARGQANGVLVTLGRNSDVWSMADTIQQVEDRFNHQFHYDWVFFNDEPFSEEFIQVTSSMMSGNSTYVMIDKSQWSVPDWIDEQKAAEGREALAGVIYGESIPYRHMCRFNSGFLHQHPVLAPYRWYWRVDTDIKLFCDMNYDIFKFMEDNNKAYAFTISMYEFDVTVRTLWPTAMEFFKANPHTVAANNLLQFVSDNNGQSYNMCHFWSNFEVADLDFFRSKAYRDYFEHLDKSGGFFYERWGDAPVHTIAAAMMLDRDKFHYFGDIGYYHIPFFNCPADSDTRRKLKCVCNPRFNHAWRANSCTPRFYEAIQKGRPIGFEAFADNFHYVGTHK